MFSKTCRQPSPATFHNIVYLAVLAVFTINVQAAGFINYIQSARSAGTGGSLATAGEFDASAIFYNPAGLPKSDKTEFLFSTPIGKPTVNFENEGTLNPIGIPVTGNTKTKEDVFVTPNIALISKYDEKTTIGIGVYIPFGQIREYDKNWVGRYHATNSELKTVTFNPSIRYDFNDAFSLGAALHVEYIDVTLDSAIDFGSLCVATSGLGLAGCSAIGLAPMAADGKQSLEGDDWGAGFSIGLLYKPNDNLNIGLSYRSKIEHELDGTADYDVPTAALPLTLGGAFTDTNISMDMTLPEVVSIGASYRVNERFNLYADAAFTRWSRFDKSVVQYDNPAQPTLTIIHDWDDVWRFALGGDYRLSPSSYIALGVAYDESPIPANRVGAILPENDSWMYSIGYGLDISEDLSVDLTYVRYEVDDVRVRNYTPESGLLSGKYELGNEAIGIQINGSF